MTAPLDLPAQLYFTIDGKWIPNGIVKGATCAVCGETGHILATGGILKCRCGADRLVAERKEKTP